MEDIRSLILMQDKIFYSSIIKLKAFISLIRHLSSQAFYHKIFLRSYFLTTLESQSIHWALQLNKVEKQSAGVLDQNFVHFPTIPLIQINQLMADSAELSHRKSAIEKPNLNSRRPSEFQSSPISYDQSQVRSIHPIPQPQLQEKKIFGFEIYIDNDILNEIGIFEDWFISLSKTHGVEQIKFNSDLTIPDLNGRNIQIYDVEMEKKYQCAKAMLSDVYQAFKKNKKEAFSVIIFVPEGMVSLLIGAKGHQINKIMKESHTTIVVNQPINRMTYRTAKIQGYHSDIAKACRIIYEMLQEKSAIAYSIEKEPSQLDYTKSKIKSKFIFTDQLVTFIEKKKKKLLQKVEEETKCSIKFQSEKQNRLLKKQQSICVMNGRLEDVQSMIVMVINVSHEFLSEQKRNIDYTLRMLIPANYVTKLIGQKGYMIRDIIDRSGGAQIKILSDKQEKDRQCIISINGTKENKIDAACFILEQIECFKNGGPILQSGKSINQNLAQQFKNSLPLREDEPDGKIDIQPEPNVTMVDESPAKMQQPQGSQQEGLIQAEQSQKQKDQRQKEEREKIEKEKRAAIERDLQRINPIKKQKENSKRSKSGSNSRQISPLQRSRSRDKDKKKSKKLQFSKKGRSDSESGDYRHDREHLQVKIIVPKKLGLDQKQLKYIQSLCKCAIAVADQKLESAETILIIRGNTKDNTRCIQLLQKRLLRYKNSNTSSAR